VLLKVDLTYYVHNGKLFCGRHYAENLKPRCGECDELIFDGQYTKVAIKRQISLLKSLFVGENMGKNDGSPNVILPRTV